MFFQSNLYNIHTNFGVVLIFVLLHVDMPTRMYPDTLPGECDNALHRPIKPDIKQPVSDTSLT